MVDLLTIQLGADQVLLCARLDIVDPLSAADVERAMVRIGEDVRTRFADIVEVFLEPVPRHDPVVRDRVRARYGEAVATEMVEEAALEPGPG